MHLLKQNTSATVLVGPVLDADGVAYTSMVIGDFSITKNGTVTALAASATATHDHNGHYLIALTTGNTDTLGRLAITSNKATYAMPATRFTVLTASTFDAIVTNAATAVGGLQDVQRIAGTAQTAADVGSLATAINAKTTNLPAAPASTTNITAGTITTVTNLTNAPTAGDFTATMKAATLARVTLVDTTTTNTDMRGTNNAMLAASYTAPDNAGIAAIKAQTDKFHFVAGEIGGTYDVVVQLSGAQPTITTNSNASILSLTNGSATVGTQLQHLDADVSSAGGGGATAADVWTYAARTLTGGPYTYTGPVDPNTNAVGFVAGDAVTCTWTVSTTDYPTIANGDVTKLRFIRTSLYKRAGASAAAELEVTGAASIASTTITFSFTISTANSALLTTVYPADNAPTHQVQVKVPTRGQTPVEAEATIRRNIAAAS